MKGLRYKSECGSGDKMGCWVVGVEGKAGKEGKGSVGL